MTARQDELVQAVYRGALQFRNELNNPEYITGNRLGGGLVAAFYATIIASTQDVAPRGSTLPDMVAAIPGAPMAVRAFTDSVWRNVGVNAATLTLEEKEERVNEMKRTLDRFIATGPEGKIVRENVKGLVALKGMSKKGLPLSEDMEREVVAFLSPSGKSEEVGTAISRSATALGKPGVRVTPESAPHPGPAAAGAGPPAGGKRRKTRRSKGKSRRTRHSRRR